MIHGCSEELANSFVSSVRTGPSLISGHPQEPRQSRDVPLWKLQARLCWSRPKFDRAFPSTLTADSCLPGPSQGLTVLWPQNRQCRRSHLLESLRHVPSSRNGRKPLPTFLHLRLLLTARHPTLISFEVTSPLTVPAVYSNRSGNHCTPLPTAPTPTPSSSFSLESTRLGPTTMVLIWKNSSLSGVSHQAFSVWAYYPNGTFYHQVAHDLFKREDLADRSFGYSIANNHDPCTVFGTLRSTLRAG